jgi:hypothetical protein
MLVTVEDARIRLQFAEISFNYFNAWVGVRLDLLKEARRWIGQIDFEGFPELPNPASYQRF